MYVLNWHYCGEPRSQTFDDWSLAVQELERLLAKNYTVSVRMG